MKKTHTDRPNVYKIVTDRIIASLKAGIIPWEKPWKAPTFGGGSLPRNFLTGKPYRGVNVFLLWGTRFSSPFWLTFKQALELGGNVRKGEKGAQIVFTNSFAAVRTGPRMHPQTRKAARPATVPPLFSPTTPFSTSSSAKD